MPILVSHTDTMRQMRKEKVDSLFDIITLARERKRIASREIAALQTHGLSVAQADALAFVGLCGGSPSYITMHFAKIRPQTIGKLEALGLLVRAVENKQGGGWIEGAGYVILTKPGVDLLRSTGFGQRLSRTRPRG